MFFFSSPFSSLKLPNRLNKHQNLACENIRFSSLFATGYVLGDTSPAAKSEEKRMFSQANQNPDVANLKYASQSRTYARNNRLYI